MGGAAACCSRGRRVRRQPPDALPTMPPCSCAHPHTPTACNPRPHAGETWWSSQFLLPGAQQPLSKEQQIAVTHTLAAWGEVVDGLPEDAQGTTAEHLEEAWAQVGSVLLLGAQHVHMPPAAAGQLVAGPVLAMPRAMANG